MNQTELEALRQVAGRASSLLGSLANPDRLMILCTLVQGECNVGELAQRSGISQPTLSQQLTVFAARRADCQPQRGQVRLLPPGKPGGAGCHANFIWNFLCPRRH